MKVLYVFHRNIFSGAEKVLVDMLSTKGRLWSCAILISQDMEFNSIDSDVDILRSNNLSSLSDRGLWYYLRDTFLSYFEIWKIINEQNIDVIHFNTYFSAIRNFPLIIFLRVMKKDVLNVYTLHDIFTTKRAKLSARILALFIHKVIYVSNATRLQFKDSLLIKNRGAVIYNGVNEEDVRRQEKEVLIQEPVNGYRAAIVGILDPWKGQLDFVRSGHSSIFDAVYLLGGGSNLSYTSLLKLELPVNVHLLGYSKHPFALLRENYVTVLLVTSMRPDPFPTVVLEAIVNGFIPVVPDEGGAMEALPKDYQKLLVYRARDYGSIKRILLELKSRDKNVIINDLRAHLVAHFTNKIKLKKHHDLYSRRD